MSFKNNSQLNLATSGVLMAGVFEGLPLLLEQSKKTVDLYPCEKDDSKFSQKKKIISLIGQL